MAGQAQKEAQQVLADAMAEILGRNSEAHRDIVRAIESEEMMDMILAQSSFDALPGDARKKIAVKTYEFVQSTGHGAGSQGGDRP